MAANPAGAATQKAGYLHEDFRLFYNRDRGLARVPLHYHDFHKIWILLSGNASYVIEGSRYDLQPMDIVLVRAGTMHRPLVHDNSLYERLILYLSDDFSITRDVFGDVPGYRELIRPGAGEQSALEPVLRSLVLLSSEDHREDTPALYGQDLYRQIKTTELMIWLRRSFEGSALGAAPVTDPITAAVMALVRENLTDPDLCVDTVARGVGLHRSYLMHHFKRATGSTLARYITEKRLFLARSLLNRGKGATEACYESGFNSYSSFFRAYREKYGVSPGKKPQESIPYPGDL